MEFVVKKKFCFINVEVILKSRQLSDAAIFPLLSTTTETEPVKRKRFLISHEVLFT